MIEERKLLQELVDMVGKRLEKGTSLDSDLMLKLAQRAESLLERGSENAVVEVDPTTVDSIRSHLDDIINPVVPYKKEHLDMCQYVIEDNKDAARAAWCDLEMIVE